MNKKTQIGLGILSALPLPLISIITVALLNLAPIGELEPTVEQYMNLLTTFNPLLSTGWTMLSFLTFGLSIFYIYHAIRNRAITNTKKMTWLISLWLFNIIAIPLYWLLHILTLPKAEPEI